MRLTNQPQIAAITQGGHELVGLFPGPIFEGAKLQCPTTDDLKIDCVDRMMAVITESNDVSLFKLPVAMIKVFVRACTTKMTKMSQPHLLAALMVTLNRAGSEAFKTALGWG